MIVKSTLQSLTKSFIITLNSQSNKDKLLQSFWSAYFFKGVIQVRKLYLLGIVLVCLTVFIQTAMVANAQQETPPAYAKWGQMAIKEVKAKYPSAKIIDYLHEGKEVHGASTIEKFKLWLKQPDKEFGVYVRISYQSATQKVEKIELQESTS